LLGLLLYLNHYDDDDDDDVVNWCLFAGALVSGHYSLRMDVTSSVISEGESVTITCELHNKLVNTSPTFVFVKKLLGGADNVKIASNHVLEALFQRTGRYRIERNDTRRMRHVVYTLRISSRRRRHMIIFIHTTMCRDRQTDRQTDQKKTIQSIQQSKYKSTKNVPARICYVNSVCLSVRLSFCHDPVRIATYPTYFQAIKFLETRS